MIKSIFRWIFKGEIRQLQRKINECGKTEQRMRVVLDELSRGVSDGIR